MRIKQSANLQFSYIAVIFSKLSPCPLVSKRPRLTHPREIATVGSKEARFLAFCLTSGSYTAELMKLVPKYTKVPVIAATLALEKKAWSKTHIPKSERPKIHKNKKITPLLEFLMTLIERTIKHKMEMIVTTTKQQVHHDSQQEKSLKPIIFIDSLALDSFSATTFEISLYTGKIQINSKKNGNIPFKTILKSSETYPSDLTGTKVIAIEALALLVTCCSTLLAIQF